MGEFSLEFEKPIIDLEDKIRDMKAYSIQENVELNHEIKQLESKLEKLTRDTYNKLTRWQRVQLSRHPDRPHATDYIQLLFTDFLELHGDRQFADDPSIVAGLGKLDKHPVVIIAQEKGRTTKEKLFRNFGMMNPEGYRKALRLMKMAAKFNKPIISFIDTMGAYPGLGAEERGQGEAIARNIFEMSRLPVPVVVVIIGEGASGGALGIGVGDRVLMMENSWYSVISPEGCAAILWKEKANEMTETAAELLKVTAPDLLELKVIDDIIPEPVGGAHRDYNKAAQTVKEYILKHLSEIEFITSNELIESRLEKYGSLGYFKE